MASLDRSPVISTGGEPAAGEGLVASGVRPVTRAMRWMMLVAAIFVFNAGIQLFIWTEHTDRYFAWTIKSPLMAAFLGGAYWASGVLEFQVFRERVWAHARVAVPAVLVFTTLTLVVTLVHLDRFHLNSPNFDTLLVTWLWMGVYVGVPPVLAVILARQLRVPGGDPSRVAPLARWLRVLLVAQAVVMLPLGAVFLAAPEAIQGIWPWALTPLTGRALGVWLLGWGLVAAQSWWENDYRRVRPGMLGFVALGALELVALARFPMEVSWSAPKTWLYLAFVLSLLAVGLYGWAMAARRSSEF